MLMHSFCPKNFRLKKYAAPRPMTIAGSMDPNVHTKVRSIIGSKSSATRLKLPVIVNCPAVGPTVLVNAEHIVEPIGMAYTNT